MVTLRGGIHKGCGALLSSSKLHFKIEVMLLASDTALEMLVLICVAEKVKLAYEPQRGEHVNFDCG